MKNPIRPIWNDLSKKGSFVQNSAWMFASSGTSIIIQFAFFYILARIYSPAVYGLFGIFNVYSNTLGNAATLGFSQAFVLPKTDREFTALLKLTFRVSIMICGGFMLLTIPFGKSILSLFGHEEMGNWIYWVAPISLLIAFDRITSDWAIRNKEFKMQTVVSVSTTFVSKAYNVFHGIVIAPTVAGLVFTTIVQYVLRISTYLKFVISDTKTRWNEKVTKKELLASAREYKGFPIYVHWANVLNIFSNNMPAALLPLLGFSLMEVGFYVNSIVLLDIPIRLLGAGIASVFMQKATELHHNRAHELKDQTWRVFKYIVYVSSLFTFIVIIWGEKLYTLIFSETWSQAGRAAEVLIIFYFFRMISSPLSSLFNILRNERASFIFQIILAIVRALSLIFGSFYTDDFIELMLCYSIANSVMYFIYCVWIFHLIRYPLFKVISFTLLISLITIGMALMIKWGIS